jgi:plasmid stability protein
MADLQVKNLSDALHRRLRRYAQKHHRTISDVAREAIERGMESNDWHEKLSRRDATDLGDSAASLLEQERQQREGDLECPEEVVKPQPSSYEQARDRAIARMRQGLSTGVGERPGWTRDELHER